MEKLLLAAGAHGELVRKLQLRLADLGHDPGSPDGDYGTGTARAVRKFRRGIPPSKLRVREPWRSGFRRFGELPEVQAIQLAHVDERFKEDVRFRKLALATGAGKVHGGMYVLRNWGLDSSPIAG